MILVKKDTQRGLRMRVIGVGSPHGGDRVGWLACERLREGGSPAGIDWRQCTVPAQLPAMVAGCDALVILDALIGEGQPGEVVRLSRAQLGAERAW